MSGAGKDAKTNKAAPPAGTKSAPAGGAATAAAGGSAAAAAAASADTRADVSKVAQAALSASKDAKARGLLVSADEKINAWSWFGSGQSNKEEAVELFEKAAAQYKLAKEWEAAAGAYIRAGETCDKYLKNSESEASNFYLQAAKAYKNAGSSKDAQRLFGMVVTLHMENNRFSAAAKLWKEIAEIEEKDGNIPAAVAAWEHAADCHFADDQQTNGNQCLLKIAHYAALREDYKKAIDIYEKVAAASAANSLLQYSVKEYLFKAILCHFVLASRTDNILTVNDVNEKYKNMAAAWDNSREQKLIDGLVKAYDAGNATQFTDLLFGFDRISKLDSWTSTLLLAVKKQLTAQVTPYRATNTATTPTTATATATATVGSSKPVGTSAPVGSSAVPDMQGSGAAPDLQGGHGSAAADEPNMM